MESDDPNFRLLNGVIPAKVTVHNLIVGVPNEAAAGRLFVLRLVGHAEMDGRQVASLVETMAYVRTARPQLALPPAWLDGLVSVATGGEAPAFFAIKPSTDSVEFPADAAQAQFTVGLERTNQEFKDPIIVLLEGLPPDFAYTIKPDKDNYQITVSGPKDAAPSRHSLRAIGYGAFKGSGQIVSKDLVLNITSKKQG
jgi:hypothetical protein